jgi:hypothetical protein
MKNIKTTTFLVVLIIGSLSIACTVTNKYGPYYGKVVDIDTKQPIEGAAVLVVYLTEQYGLAGPVSHFADAQETLTDKNGEFKIPAIRINTFRLISGWDRYPHFNIFKPGYGCFPTHKYAKRQRKAIEEDASRPDWSLPPKEYVTIELPAVKNESREERLRNTACLPSPSVPDKRFKKLRELLEIEYKSIGY